MLRSVAPLLTLSALAAFAPHAAAQRGLPLSPGVHPGSPIGPGMQFLPQPTPRFVPLGHGFGTTVMARPGQNLGFGFGGAGLYSRSGFGLGYGGFYGGFGYGYGGYGYGGYGYGGYGYPGGPTPVYIPVPVLPPQPNVILANEFPATLTVQLPPGKEMQVNGKPVPDDTPAGYSLTSPVLKQGEKYTFNVNVRWQSGGKTYEAKRSVMVGPGDHSRLLIVSGEEVKE
jgi:uncharacterized protein (TIGR03000 family)